MKIEARDIRMMIYQFLIGLIGLWMTFTNNFSKFGYVLAGGVIMMFTERGIYKREEIY